MVRQTFFVLQAIIRRAYPRMTAHTYKRAPRGENVYLDLLFFLNLLLNYLLLLITARLLQRRPGFWRLLAGAALGAAAVGLLLLPSGLSWVIPGAVVLVPAAMVPVVFWPLKRAELPLIWGAFFLVSFTAGGIVIALIQLFELSRRGGLTGWRGLGVLVLACFMLYLSLGLLRPYVEERRWQQALQARVRVSWDGKAAELPALIDTGNRLREPFGQRPVIVVDFRSLEAVLPHEIYASLSDPAQQPWQALDRLAGSAQACSFILIPVRGVGGGETMLLGLRPDSVAVDLAGRIRTLDRRLVLGLQRHGFGPVARYRALLPPEVMAAG